MQGSILGCLGVAGGRSDYGEKTQPENGPVGVRELMGSSEEHGKLVASSLPLFSPLVIVHHS